MTDPLIKAVPDKDSGTLHFVMDQAGFGLFQRLLARAVPRKTDSPANFNEINDRISGAFLAGAIQMGWDDK